MNSKNIVTCLKQVAVYLKIVPGKLSVNSDGLCTHTRNKNTVTGVFNIIDDFLTESRSELGRCNREEKFLVRQWIEYSIVYASSTCENNSDMFNLLNEIFRRKTYLLGTKLSIADIMLYYMIQKNVERLTYLEKENYINVCRWFDNIQQDAFIRQSNTIVDFSTIYLAKALSVTH